MLAAMVASLTIAFAAAPVAQGRGIGGVVPDIPSVGFHSPRAASSAPRLPYAGGPVLHHNRTHVIFWQPAGSGLSFDRGYEALIERFLTGVAADSHRQTNTYSLSGQYRDAKGPAAYDSAYGGAVVDTDPLPPSECFEPPFTGPGWTVCLTDAQLQREIEQVLDADRLPDTGSDIYFLVTPRGLGSCFDATSTSCALGGSENGYCGYHSQTSTGVLYAVIPYNAMPGHCESDNPRPNGSTADPSISTISHEHNETVTDPLTNAWVDGAGNEEADLCITSFGPKLGGRGHSVWNESIAGGHYYLQEVWSDQDRACEQRAKPDRVWLSGSLRAQAGQAVRLTGHAVAAHGSITAYAWFFGDGAISHNRVASHAFKRPGTYRVVLRTTDQQDNWAYDAVTVRVSSRPAKKR